MSCERIEVKLPDYVAGHLDESAECAVRTHLGACDSCSDYHGKLVALYRLPDPAAADLLPPPALRPYRWHQRPVTVGVGIAVAALLAVVFGFWMANEQGPFEPLPLPTVSLQLPAFPTEYPEPGIFSGDYEAALKLSRYTGKPVLEEFSSQICPRCRHVRKLLDETPETLDEYIVLRREMGEDVQPDWVRDLKPDGRLMFLLPAMRITDGFQASDPIWEVYQLDSVRALTADWEATQREAGESRLPLNRAQFTRTVDDLLEVPGLVQRREYAEALGILRRVEALGESQQTQFVEVARDAEKELIAQLRSAVDSTRALQRGPRRDRRAANDLAVRLARDLIGTPLEGTLTP